MIGDKTREIARKHSSKRDIVISTKPFKPPKIRKPIRWFWNHWIWRRFWYTYTWNGIIGPGGRSYATFRTSRLALIISIFALILVIIMFFKIVFV